LAGVSTAGIGVPERQRDNNEERGDRMRREILTTALLCAVLAIPAAAAAHDARGGYLGVSLAQAKDGVLVTGVIPGSPAERAGLEVGDRIVGVDGKATATDKALRDALHEHEAGQRVTVEVMRDGDRRRIEVTLGERHELRGFARDNVLALPDGVMIEPDAGRTLMRLTHRPRLGVSIVELSDELREYFGVERGRGVLVSSVSKDSAAERAGLRAGDVIVAVGGQPVDEAGDIGRALKKGESVEVELFRDRARMTLSATIEN
jgi:serine protease Do